VKMIYRGHEIDAHRGRSAAGYDLMYYSIFRASDGYECDSGFSDCSDTEEEFVEMLRERVDAELAESNPWRGEP
jgi:hypothetical protein